MAQMVYKFISYYFIPAPLRPWKCSSGPLDSCSNLDWLISNLFTLSSFRSAYFLVSVLSFPWFSYFEGTHLLESSKEKGYFRSKFFETLHLFCCHTWFLIQVHWAYCAESITSNLEGTAPFSPDFCCCSWDVQCHSDPDMDMTFSIFGS